MRYLTVMITLLLLSIGIVGTSAAQTPVPAIDYPVRAVQWNMDGTYTSTVASNGTVRIYEMPSQSLVFIIDDYGNGIYLDWNPINPHQFVVSNLDGNLQIIDLDLGETVQQFIVGASTYSVAFSPDGSQLLTSHSTPPDGGWGSRGAVRVTDIETGTEPIIFQDTANRVTSALWSLDGQVISGRNICDYGEIILWDANTGIRLQRVSYLEETVTDEGIITTGSIQFYDWSPDNSQMAIAIELEILFVSTTDFAINTTSDRIFSISDVDWSPDGSIVAVGGGFDQNIYFVDPLSGEIFATIPIDVFQPVVAWSPDGSQLAYGTATGVEIIAMPDVELEK